jgi:hypothetical protein
VWHEVFCYTIIGTIEEYSHLFSKLARPTPLGEGETKNSEWKVIITYYRGFVWRELYQTSPIGALRNGRFWFWLQKGQKLAVTKKPAISPVRLLRIPMKYAVNPDKPFYKS